jgi:hypothetical protein
MSPHAKPVAERDLLSTLSRLGFRSNLEGQQPALDCLTTELGDRGYVLVG